MSNYTEQALNRVLSAVCAKCERWSNVKARLFRKWIKFHSCAPIVSGQSGGRGKGRGGGIEFENFHRYGCLRAMETGDISIIRKRA